MLRKTFGFGSLLLVCVLAAGCEKKKEKVVDIDTTGPKGNGVSVEVDRGPGGVDVEVKKD